MFIIPAMRTLLVLAALTLAATVPSDAQQAPPSQQPQPAGRSHTGGDSLIYYPDLKVLLTSDAVTVGAGGPLVDYAGGGSALEWRRVLDDMLALDWDTAIPGAGPVLTRAGVVAFRTKFNTVVDRLSGLVRQGVPKDPLLMRLEADDIGWAPRIPQVDALVDELSKASAPR